jgi:cytochrome c oxidase subunit III
MNVPSSTLDPPRHETRRGGPTPPDAGGPGGGGGGENGDSERRRRGPMNVAVLGMWVALAPILMLFLAFASAYVVRHGVGWGWTPGPLPHILYLNTVVLFASSLALERARAVQRAAGGAGSRVVADRNARRWVMVTLALGVIFVAGQSVAWLEVHQLGFHMSTTPHTSFFYVLTVSHAIHVLGGLAGLVAVIRWPEAGWRRASLGVALQVIAIYWHFLFALWLGLFALLSLLR